jgi:nitrogen fixation protein FixH
MTTSNASQPFRLTGWHVLAAVVAFFGVIIAVDGLFIAAAYRTFPGQVSVTPYEDGLAYNQRMAQQRAQTALGWRVAVSLEAGGLTIQVADKAAAPVAGLALSGALSRPATDAGRLPLIFTELAPGRYEAQVAPGPGAWDLMLTGRAKDGAVLEAERRLTWP